MKKYIIYFAGIVVAGVLSGCGMNTLRLSPEEKINAAYPISESLSKSVASLLTSVKSEKRGDVQSKLDDQLKRRVTVCAKGFSPSWYSTIESVRKALNAEACFTEFDARLAQWVGIRRAGVALAAPAAVQPATKLTTSITTTDPIRWLHVAQKAGLVLVDSNERIEIVNLETGKPVYKESKKVNESGVLSPNGRLFFRRDGAKLVIKSAENGEVFFELPAPLEGTNDFMWVDERTAIRKDKGRSIFMDFTSGTDVPIDDFKGEVRKVVAIPDQADTYVLMGPYRVARVTLDRSNQAVRIIAEKTVSAFDMMNWGFQSVVTEDASEVIQSQGFGGLHTMSMATLETGVATFAPFTIYKVTPTADPDQLLLLIGAVGSDSGTSLIMYSRGTLNTARVASDADSESAHKYDQYAYAPSLKQNIIYSGNTIKLVDSIPVKETIPLAILKDDIAKTIQRATAAREYAVAHRTDADRARIRQYQEWVDNETRRYIPEYRRIPNENDPAVRSSKTIDQFREQFLERKAQKERKVPVQ